MRQNYTESGQWWMNNHSTMPSNENLPHDLHVVEEQSNTVQAEDLV